MANEQRISLMPRNNKFAMQGTVAQHPSDRILFDLSAGVIVHESVPWLRETGINLSSRKLVWASFPKNNTNTHHLYVQEKRGSLKEALSHSKALCTSRRCIEEYRGLNKETNK